MDQSNLRLTQAASGLIGDPSKESGDWRAHLQENVRQKMHNMIIKTIERHYPMIGHEGLQNIKKIVVRFEEKVYSVATSQSDYLRKISMKMVGMKRSENPMPDLIQANKRLNPADPEMAGILGGGKSNKIWTKEEDTLLVDALMKLHVSGEYVYANIKQEYVHAVQRLMGSNLFDSAESIKTRMEFFKKNFNIVLDMLAGTHMSGFSWDPEKLCVIADDKVWDEYIKKHTDAAQFRTQPFPHYEKLHTIFCKDIAKHHQADNSLGGEDEGIAEEYERNPCLEAKDLHVSGNVSSFYGYKESVGGSKRKRDEHNGRCETCVGSLDVLKNAIEDFGRVFFENLEEMANERINASNEMMDKVMSQMNDLYGLTEDECLKAMSIIGRSAPLFHMFDRLDEDGKLRMAQMVADGSII